MRYFCTILLFLLFSYSEFERGLNLSDSQRSQVEGIRNRYIDEWRALKQESIQKRLEMRELRRERSNNGGREDMLRSEIRSIEQSRENLFNRYRSEVSRVLNPEQKSRYDNFSDMERRRNMHPSRLREHGR
jgi:Spy/CpxP family protein refolding chaperone